MVRIRFDTGGWIHAGGITPNMDSVRQSQHATTVPTQLNCDKKNQTSGTYAGTVQVRSIQFNNTICEVVPHACRMVEDRLTYRLCVNQPFDGCNNSTR